MVNTFCAVLSAIMIGLFGSRCYYDMRPYPKTVSHYRIQGDRFMVFLWIINLTLNIVALFVK